MFQRMFVRLVGLLSIQLFMVCNCRRIGSSNACSATSWAPDGTTVAGGHGLGDKLNQFNSSYGVTVHPDGAIFVTDFFNHRVMKWERNAASGIVWTGGRCGAIELGQLCNPTAIASDRSGNLYVAAESGTDGSVIVFKNGSTVGETLIFGNTSFYGIVVDKKGEYLYVGHHRAHRVVKYTSDGRLVGVVAGDHGPGVNLNQLDYPRGVAVDADGSVYVSDSRNHRVMKWLVNATDGIVMAGGHGNGSALDQLSTPGGLILDQMGSIYVADEDNQRIIRINAETRQISMIAGGNGRGNASRQFSGPFSLTMDSQENIYVADWGNARIQRFTSEPSPCSGAVGNYFRSFTPTFTFFFSFIFLTTRFN